MTKQTKHLSVIGLVGLLLVFLLQGSNAILSPAIAAIANALKMAPGTVAQVGTVPALFSVISGLLAGRFAGRVIKYKTFTVWSLLICIVGGSSAAVIPTWPMIMFSRACVGFGVGVFYAIPPVLIMKFYEGDAQRNKLGLANAFASVGGLLMMFTVGVLVDIQWNSVFWINLVGASALVLILMGLQEPESEVTVNQTTGEKEKLKIPLPVVLNFVMIFLTGLFGMNALMFISNVITDRGLGTGVHSGTVAIMFNVSATALSFFFGPLYKIFNKYFAIIIIVLVGIGLVLVYYASSLVMAGAGMFCVGTFLLMIPTLLTDNAQQLSPGSMTFAASFLGVVLNVGNFVLGPYIHATTTIGKDVLSPLFFGIFGLAGTAVVFFIIRLLQKAPASSPAAAE